MTILCGEVGLVEAGTPLPFSQGGYNIIGIKPSESEALLEVAGEL